MLDSPPIAMFMTPPINIVMSIILICWAMLVLVSGTGAAGGVTVLSVSFGGFALRLAGAASSCA